MLTSLFSAHFVTIVSSSKVGSLHKLCEEIGMGGGEENLTAPSFGRAEQNEMNHKTIKINY